jgi:hypothetical protein
MEDPGDKFCHCVPNDVSCDAWNRRVGITPGVDIMFFIYIKQ